MLRRHKRWLVQIAIAIVFVALCVTWFYLVCWLDFTDNPVVFTRQKTVTENEITFQEDVKRFLSVYLTQEFARESDRWNFVRIEAMRYSTYPIKNQAELALRDNLLKNLEKIIIKSRQEQVDVSAENEQLRAILKELP